ncbi:MAG: ATP-dependent endonuclease [Nitrososphaerota archaeon]|jgi:predicted ATP-dependent endonuclease of OLD family|nr:AAA family ATPase [Nitrososphaerota archaeon]MDG6932690.1 ATP-dependent endonuclease [Nitrososphaerota archaeon]MDG6935524.1 ATP-dependent endonuclease [Nitrososphaerota archaeon]MDG6943419.1 ATP-dependent endonuclease [Nitrososphaerota archaeon]
MKIRKLEIKHFTSIESLAINFSDTVALVGQNNSGKSNIIKALDLFFDPSSSKVYPESFYMKETDIPIEITVEFDRLSAKEEEYFSAYIYNHTLKVRRRIEWDKENEKAIIHHIGFSFDPNEPWLIDDKISAEQIDQWLQQPEMLSIAGISFLKYLDSSNPTVKDWKDAAKKFIKENTMNIKIQENEKENIKGFEGVLKGGLPKFILIPAIRDIRDETKVGKTNPFGELIMSTLNELQGEGRNKFNEALHNVVQYVNADGSQRLSELTILENKLNETINDFVQGCKLQLQVPDITIEDVLARVKIFADDGFKGVIEGKGHGLQRYVIFSILKAYAESLRTISNGERRRSIIFAIEEPEIYLHPQAQRIMYQVLLKIGNGEDQVIYSTHSALMVDIMYFDRLCIISRKKLDGNYKTKLKQLAIKNIIEDLKARYPKTSPTEQSIRERYFHVYSTQRNEGFFAQKVILTEGQTEEYALPIFSKALGYDFDREGVSIVSAGGKGTIDRFIRIFNEFEIPCYTICDGDKDKASKENKKETSDLFALTEKLDKVPSRTFVGERITIFVKDYEHQMREEIKNYQTYVQEAKRELGLRGDKSKPLIARYMANQLVNKGTEEGDPSKYVPKTLREIIDNVRKLEYKGSVLKVLS